VKAGIFMFEIEMLDRIPAKASSDFGHDIFPSLANHKDAIYGYRLSGDEGLWWIDNFEDLSRARSIFKDQGNEK
jgi:NDP-sugar pyrophosphorylase family protein